MIRGFILGAMLPGNLQEKVKMQFKRRAPSIGIKFAAFQEGRFQLNL
jgi:hypothetical protein